MTLHSGWVNISDADGESVTSDCDLWMQDLDQDFQNQRSARARTHGRPCTSPSSTGRPAERPCPVYINRFAEDPHRSRGV